MLGAQSGVLIKNAEALERFQKIDTVVVDKTGMLTEGKPRVTAIRPVAEEGRGDPIRTRAAAAPAIATRSAIVPRQKPVVGDRFTAPFISSNYGFLIKDLQLQVRTSFMPEAKRIIAKMYRSPLSGR